MTSPTEISDEIELSGPLVFAAGAPPAADNVCDLVEAYLPDAARGSVCLSLEGGKKRPPLKPTIKTFGDATISESTLALQQIAWAHCQEKGVRARYVAQIHIKDEHGRVRNHPERAYFDLDPDVDAPEDESEADKPSGTYVRELELMNLRSLRMLQNSSAAVLRRDEQHHRDRLKAVEAKGNTEVALARVEVEKLEATAAADRKGKIFDTARSLLPAAFHKAMGALEKGDESDDDKKLLPGPRVEAFLTADELKVFIDNIGAERWERFRVAKTFKDAREVLTDLPEDIPGKMVAAGVPGKKLAAMTTWTDEPVEGPSEDEAAE